MGPALGHFVDRGDLDASGGNRGGRAAGGHELKSEFGEHFCNAHHHRLIAIFDTDKGAARGRQFHARTHLRLHESLGEGLAHPHHFTGRFHLRPQDGVDSRKFHKRKDRLFHREVRRRDLRADGLIIQ